MIVTRKSPLSGVVHSMDLPITQEQLHEWKNGGRMIQDVFPHLSAEDREFILTGITGPEWDEAFGVGGGPGVTPGSTDRARSIY